MKRDSNWSGARRDLRGNEQVDAERSVSIRGMLTADPGQECEAEAERTRKFHFSSETKEA